ncbi:helix-turn-helix domain-containing protein [Nonomuraea polychroma]|uniref:helix-turn-helix domain-containing protein n=1 Tax=Nonomuraea polychroma TaxID=46176 RepID=UPI003D926637
MPSAVARTGPVVARALQILGAFTADRRSLTLSDLSRHSGLPVSTVHRLAAELVAWARSNGTRPAATTSACGCGRSARSPRAVSACARRRCRTWRTCRR